MKKFWLYARLLFKASSFNSAHSAGGDAYRIRHHEIRSWWAA